jgi:hypothetical protein
MVVVHADHVEQLLAEAASRAELTLVVVQSDRGRQPQADFTIVQNASSARPFHFFIPSWSQPGLIPRARARDTQVETIAYLGSIAELHSELANHAWTELLRSRGFRWDLRTVAYTGNDQRYSALRWNDYSSIDVIVAVRRPRSWNARPKPAAKLQNAWAAGVPAILSPERQYQELRRSPLDYIEAGDPHGVLSAIEALRADPELYSAMVRNGFERATEFAPEQLVRRWVDVLWRQIPARARTPEYRLRARIRHGRALAARLFATLRTKPRTRSSA